MGYEVQRRSGGAVRQSGGSLSLAEVVEKNIEKITRAYGNDAKRFKDQVGHLITAAVTRNPSLGKCHPDTIIDAVCQAGTLGLSLNPTFGEAYLVPRWNGTINAEECCFQPGYLGLVKLARKSKELVSIRAAVVYDGDEFEWEYCPDLEFRHRPMLKQKGAVKDGVGVKAVYAMAKLANGERLLEVMTVPDIESVRQRSKSKNNGPWVSDWGEMAKKTVLRRLIKMLPKSDDDDKLAIALEAHDSDFDYESAPKPDNQSGHGTGMYASDQQAKAYREEIEKFLSRQNDEWRDKWTDPDTGEIPTAAKDLATFWEVDQHLVEYCIGTGRLDQSIDPKGLLPRQAGKYTAIVWHRGVKDRNALKVEAKAFIDNLKAQQTELIEREMASGDDQGDEPEVDLDFDGIEDLPEPEAAPDVTPPAPKPETLKGKNGKKQQATLIEDEPEAWPPGRE